jgi:hypothetical protein
MTTTRGALAALGLGFAAGAAGTLAMTATQEAAGWLRRGSSATAETLRQPRTWAEAPAPAQVAKRALGRRVTKRHAPLLTNVGHWSYGLALGGAYGLVQSRVRLHPLAHGVIFGAAVWGLQYAMLSPLGISDPPWRQPTTTLGIDIGHHLAYGFATAGVYEALAGR